MNLTKWIIAFLFAPLGAFLLLFVFLVGDVLTRSGPISYMGMIEASIAVLAFIYLFYFFGLVLIIPISIYLIKNEKFAIKSAMVLASSYGGIIGILWSVAGEPLVIPLCVAMGASSGYLLWLLSPQRNLNKAIKRDGLQPPLI